MGTSTDRTSGRGGAWTPLKHATTSLIRAVETDRPEHSHDRARRVAARHVAVLGGAEAAAAGARAGRVGAQRLGGLLAAIGEQGLSTALQEFGLADLVGRDRFEVLDELITLIADDGADLDAVAAREAACEVLEDIFGVAQSWDDLTQAAAATVTAEALVGILKAFLVNYIYNRMPVVAEKLSQLVDVEAIRRADDKMREVIFDVVEISLPTEPFSVDWAGSEGRDVADNAVATSYQILESLEF